MSFGPVEEDLGRDPFVGQHAVNLLRLARRHARVIRPVNQEQGCPDPVDMGQRGRLREEVALRSPPSALFG